MPESNFDKNYFLYPHRSYYDEADPQKTIFNADLQQFSQKVSYICNLETGGKITTEEAYRKIKESWKKLKSSYQKLNLND